MPSGFLKVNVKDLLGSAANAVVISFLAVVYSLSIKEGFDIFHVDWAAVLQLVVNSAISAFLGSIGKKLLTDENGTVHLGFATLK